LWRKLFGPDLVLCNLYAQGAALMSVVVNGTTVDVPMNKAMHYATSENGKHLHLELPYDRENDNLMDAGMKNAC
jgi:hypothetical protein